MSLHSIARPTVTLDSPKDAALDARASGLRTALRGMSYAEGAAALSPTGGQPVQMKLTDTLKAAYDTYKLVKKVVSPSAKGLAELVLDIARGSGDTKMKPFVPKPPLEEGGMCGGPEKKEEKPMGPPAPNQCLPDTLPPKELCDALTSSGK